MPSRAGNPPSLSHVASRRSGHAVPSPSWLPVNSLKTVWFHQPFPAFSSCWPWMILYTFLTTFVDLELYVFKLICRPWIILYCTRFSQPWLTLNDIRISKPLLTLNYTFFNSFVDLELVLFRLSFSWISYALSKFGSKFIHPTLSMYLNCFKFILF